MLLPQRWLWEEQYGTDVLHGVQLTTGIYWDPTGRMVRRGWGRESPCRLQVGLGF